MNEVLLDTSFFVRYLNPADKLHNNAKGYFKYLLEYDYRLKFSTISIAEFCTRANIHDLPLTRLQILPFNVLHAQKAGHFAECLFRNRRLNPELVSSRSLIPNDAKLLAQAQSETGVHYYITSDVRSKSMYNCLKSDIGVNFQFIDISIPHGDVFGVMPF